MASDTTQVAQDTDFWIKWRTYQIYDVLIHVYGCKMTFDSRTPDPFLVSHLEAEVTFAIPDRKGAAKTKTNNIKKTLCPRWNHTFCANSMDFSDTFELELVVTKTLLKTKVNAAHFTFAVRDITSMDSSDLAIKEFHFSSSEHSLSGSMFIGFDINPLCPLIDNSMKTIHCEEVLSPRSCQRSFSPESVGSAKEGRNLRKQFATQPAFLSTDMEYCSMLLDLPTVDLYPQIVHEVQSPLDLASIDRL